MSWNGTYRGNSCKDKGRTGWRCGHDDDDDDDDDAHYPRRSLVLSIDQTSLLAGEAALSRAPWEVALLRALGDAALLRALGEAALLRAPWEAALLRAPWEAALLRAAGTKVLSTMSSPGRRRMGLAIR